MVLNKYSNILKFPKNSDYYTDFLSKIIKKEKLISSETDFNMDIEEKPIDEQKALIVKYISLPEVKEIPSIFDYNITNLLKNGFYIVELNIIDILPKPYYNLVLAFCDKCLNSFNTKNLKENNCVFNCEYCENSQLRLYFNVQFIGRCSSYSNHLIKFYLSTYDHEGVSIHIK